MVVMVLFAVVFGALAVLFGPWLFRLFVANPVEGAVGSAVAVETARRTVKATVRRNKTRRAQEAAQAAATQANVDAIAEESEGAEVVDRLNSRFGG